MQKINYVPRTQVIRWIEYIHKTSPATGLAWGTTTDKRQLIDAVNSLPRTVEDLLDMSKLAQCIQSFYTTKLVGGANRKFIELWTLCKIDIIRTYKCKKINAT